MEENKVELEDVEFEEVSEETVQESEETSQESTQEQEVEIVDDKASEYLERLQRLMAEFDNYRKRTEKEKQNVYDLAVSETITGLLGTVDNLERALKQECTDAAFYEGMSIIYKQLVVALEKLNVTPIEAEGETFDPAFHNAIFHIEDENLGDNIVAEELQKGYKYKDKVIRYSMVKVAN